MPRNKPHTEETKRKIGLANRGIWIKYKCDFCQKECEEKRSHYNKSRKHFCNSKCFTEYRKTLVGVLAPQWKGGDSETRKRYWKKNPERIAHLKARRYARERNAEGKHTLEEWQELKMSFDNRCAICKEIKLLTKDHIRPLSEGGTDYISNIQPLCRSCNSRKWKFYENPELIK